MPEMSTLVATIFLMASCPSTYSCREYRPSSISAPAGPADSAELLMAWLLESWGGERRWKGNQCRSKLGSLVCKLLGMRELEQAWN